MIFLQLNFDDNLSENQIPTEVKIYNLSGKFMNSHWLINNRQIDTRQLGQRRIYLAAS